MNAELSPEFTNWETTGFPDWLNYLHPV